MMILAGFWLEFFIESSVKLLPDAIPNYQDHWMLLFWEVLVWPWIGGTAKAQHWSPNNPNPVWVLLFCSLGAAGGGQAPLQCGNCLLLQQGGILQEKGGGKLELPFAWCHIATVRTCIKSGWAQSCKDLALLCLFPKYVVEKESAIHWEVFVLRMLRNFLAQLKGLGEKNENSS